MRKDVKVGLASGGVLLAVIAVYTSSLNKQPTANKGGKPTLSLTGGSTETTAKRTAGSVTIESTGEPARSVTAMPTANTTVATAQGEPDWGRLLDTGAPPALMTRTPGPGEGKPSDAQRTVDVFADSTATSSRATVLGTSDPNAAGGVSTTVIVDPARLNPTPTLSATSFTPGSGASTEITPGTTPGTTASATPGMRAYVVKSGDSFYTIARDVYGNSHFFPHISRANPGIDPGKIRPGMTINVPDAASVKPTATATTSTPLVSTLMASAPSAASASTPTGTTSANEYRVGANDNLYRIAVKLYGSPKKMQELYELNKATIGEDPSKLKLNMILKLPAGAKTTN